MHRTRHGYHFSVMQDPLANAVAIPHPPPVLNPTSGGRISIRLGPAGTPTGVGYVLHPSTKPTGLVVGVIGAVTAVHDAGSADSGGG